MLCFVSYQIFSLRLHVAFAPSPPNFFLSCQQKIAQSESQSLRFHVEKCFLWGKVFKRLSLDEWKHYNCMLGPSVIWRHLIGKKLISRWWHLLLFIFMAWIFPFFGVYRSHCAAFSCCGATNETGLHTRLPSHSFLPSSGCFPDL